MELKKIQAHAKQIVNLTLYIENSLQNILALAHYFKYNLIDTHYWGLGQNNFWWIWCTQYLGFIYRHKKKFVYQHLAIVPESTFSVIVRVKFNVFRTVLHKNNLYVIFKVHKRIYKHYWVWMWIAQRLFYLLGDFGSWIIICTLKDVFWI